MGFQAHFKGYERDQKISGLVFLFIVKEMHCSKPGMCNRCHLLVGVNSRYKKWVPFLSEIVYNGVKG